MPIFTSIYNGWNTCENYPINYQQLTNEASNTFDSKCCLIALKIPTPKPLWDLSKITLDKNRYSLHLTAKLWEEKATDICTNLNWTAAIKSLFHGYDFGI